MEKLYREYNDDRANSNTGVRAMWALRGESPPLHTLLDSVGGMQIAVDYRANFQDKGPAGRHKRGLARSSSLLRRALAGCNNN